MAKAPSTSFYIAKINSTTFLIIEDDIFGEQPYIYVKLYEKYIVITDTGCNAPRSKSLALTELRKYLETFPQELNNNESLNPGGKKEYVIICSHCHYDHILGIPQFLSATPIIVRSAATS